MQKLLSTQRRAIKEFLSLSISTIENIFSNPNLLLESEDQLIKIIDYLYKKDHKYSKLYEYADFLNIEISTIKEFLTIYIYISYMI